MLPCPPAGVEIRDFDSGAVQIPERADDGGAYACLKESDKVVKAVDGVGSENVTGHGRFVQHDLLEKRRLNITRGSWKHLRVAHCR